MDSSDTETYDTEAKDSCYVPEALPPVLVGQWGLIRLYQEAKLDNKVECARWCMAAGLIAPTSDCRRHRKERTLRSHRSRGVLWWCPSCRDEVSATSGFIFYGSAVDRKYSRACVLLHNRLDVRGFAADLQILG